MEKRYPFVVLSKKKLVEILVRFNFQKTLSMGLKTTVVTPFHNADRGSPFFCNLCMVGQDPQKLL